MSGFRPDHRGSNPLRVTTCLLSQSIWLRQWCKGEAKVSPFNLLNMKQKLINCIVETIQHFSTAEEFEVVKKALIKSLEQRPEKRLKGILLDYTPYGIVNTVDIADIASKDPFLREYSQKLIDRYESVNRVNPIVKLHFPDWNPE